MIEQQLSRFLSRMNNEVKTSAHLSFSPKEWRERLSVNSETDFFVLEYIWVKFGECSFMNGLFWTINPFDFIEQVKLFDHVSASAIPIVRTARGCFLLWDIVDGENVISYLDVYENTNTFYADRMADLFNYDLISEAVWEDDLNGKQELLATKLFPDLKYEECVAPLTLELPFAPENLKKQNIFDLMDQLVQWHTKA